MRIITLTTDFGYKDPYVGALKGAIYSQLDDVRIVDISHGVSPFHLAEAAYIIKNAYKNFPKKSIHIIGVRSEEHTSELKSRGHLEGRLLPEKKEREPHHTAAPR